jgi:putative phage-type endonuclease
VNPEEKAIWRAARRELLTASDVGAVLGENKYRTREQVRMEKAGLADEFEGNERTDNALDLEPWVANQARKKFGWNLVPHGQLIVDKECPLLGATPDYMCETPWGWVNVQIKVTSVKPYEEVKSYGFAPPMMYQLQVQGEMACLGWQHSELLVFHTSILELRHYPIPRHPMAIARIRREAHLFMAEVNALKAGRLAV